MENVSIVIAPPPTYEAQVNNGIFQSNPLCSSSRNYSSPLRRPEKSNKRTTEKHIKYPSYHLPHGRFDSFVGCGSRLNYWDYVSQSCARPLVRRPIAVVAGKAGAMER